MTPNHALTMWLVEETIVIQYPDGQQIAIPTFEPSRLVAILRHQIPKPVNKLLAFKWPDSGDVYKDAKERGADIRSRETERKEREKRQRMKRVAQRDKIKEADKILELVGML